MAEARAIVEELRKYDEDLYNKPRWLVLNKIDMVEDPQRVVADFVKDYGWDGPCFAISALSGIGTKELTYAIMEHLETTKRLEAETPEPSRTDPSNIEQSRNEFPAT